MARRGVPGAMKRFLEKHADQNDNQDFVPQIPVTREIGEVSRCR